MNQCNKTESSTLLLGSLFDGSGGFPLAGLLCGVTPVWASEIEPYPIAVTKSRFPNMKHLGNISKIDGAKIEPVDIITFGSPCQDLSVAGKREGLKHIDNGDDETTRSGLFMEAIRVIKEMREATDGEYPKIILWENVPGAFSSNKGEDFRIVLEEIIKIAEPGAVMPAVPQGGWAYADCYVGDGWSIAYRVLDAEYWGVAQRRRRIYLVADFRSERAGEILFKRKGLRGNFKAGREAQKTIAANSKDSIRTTDSNINNIGINGSVAATLDASYFKGCGMRNGIEREVVAIPIVDSKCFSFDSLSSNSMKSKNPNSGCREVDKAKTLDTTYPDPSKNQGGIAVVQKKSEIINLNKGDIQSKMVLDSNGIAPTLYSGECRWAGGECYVLVKPSVVYPSRTGALMASGYNKNGTQEAMNGMYVVEKINCPSLMPKPASESGVFSTLYAAYGTKWNGNSGAYNGENLVLQPTAITKDNDVVIGIDRAAFNQGKNAKYDFTITDNQSATLVARGPNAVCCPLLENESDKEFETHYIVRRLTPMECCRLQGFPDGYANIDIKENFTDEEYKFWISVRNEQALINNKKNRDYTKKQMLTWYNKLHTDSAEYKMWGNGIALPTALYVMEGITDALNND